MRPVRITAAIASLALLSLVSLPVARAAPAIAFAAPLDGARVGGPQVLVRLSVSGLRLVDAGTPVASGEGHAHVYVDREPVKPGETIPTDQPNIVHLGKAPYDERTLVLSNGRHTLWAQLADSSHVALGVPASRIALTVATAHPAVSIVAPASGSTAAGPRVDVWLAINGLKTVDAGRSVASGEGHAHLYVDREPVKPGEKIPADQPNIVHLGKAPYDSRALSLPDGRHTLWAQLADSSHVALDSTVAKSTFTVAPGFRGRGTIEPACAEVATGTSDARLLFPSGGGLLQGSISSHCGFRTEGGACSWVSLSTRRVLGSYDARTNALTGAVYGASEQRLEEGDAARCGPGTVVPEPPGTMSGSLSGDTVTGSMGLARLVVRSDPAVVLEAPALPVAPPAVQDAAPVRRATRSVPFGPIAGGVVAVGAIAGIGVLARIRRRPAPVAATPAVRTPAAPARPATQAPRCPSCGEPRRAGARFCFSCGKRY